MIYVYIGAALLVSLLVGLTSLSIIWLTKRVDAGLRTKSIELLSSYDIKLEEKALKLCEIEEQLTNKEKNIINTNVVEPIKVVKEDVDKTAFDFLNAVQRVGSTTYRDKEVFEVYRKIKNSFVVSADNISKVLADIKFNKRNGVAKKVLSELNYSTIYELSTLPEDTQKELLEECLDEDGKKLLKEFEFNCDKFSSLSFYDFLKGHSEDLDATPIIYVSNYDIDKKYPSDIIVKTDSNICEGFVVKVGNKVYDYSIKENEMI